jgi:5'-deoxynucleotidase YfbR-like HD superfamily hydrolase
MLLFKATLPEIAIGMSRINRWSGRGAFAISIAQHSVLLSHFVQPRLAKAALLHDVSEFYMGGDISSPIKNGCPDLLRKEESIQRTVFASFSVPWSEMLDIHWADLAIRNDERKALWPDTPLPEGAVCLGAIFEEMTALAAADAWLNRVIELWSL